MVSLSSSGLCFVFRAQTLLDSFGTGLSPCVLRLLYSERKVVACPYHTLTLHCEGTPWFGGY